MNSATVTMETGSGGILSLRGELTLATVALVYEQLQDRYSGPASAPAAVVDMAGITSADSAGVALMIKWVRLARQHNKTIEFQHIPDQVLPLARLFGVEHLLH